MVTKSDVPRECILTVGQICFGQIWVITNSEEPRESIITVGQIYVENKCIDSDCVLKKPRNKIKTDKPTDHPTGGWTN